jgi:hypothetical protein
MTTKNVKTAISGAYRATDKLSDALCGSPAFPLAMLLDDVLFALQAVVDGDQTTEVDDLIAITRKRVANTLARL